MIRSQYYSENGKEPVGEVSVTKYSTDPKDLGSDEDLVRRGITSITTTQKFGSKDAPSFKTVTDNKKVKYLLACVNRGHRPLSILSLAPKSIFAKLLNILQQEEEEDDEIRTTTTRTFTRRGSVKAISQKFIENAGKLQSIYFSIPQTFIVLFCS